MKKVPGDLISLTLVSQVSEFVAMLISGYLYPKIGPRLGHIYVLIMAAISSIFLMIYWNSNSPKLILILIMIAKFGVTAAFNIVFIAWIELIPTILNATAFGYANTIARVFNSMSSLVAETNYIISITYIICCCFASIIASSLLVIK